MDGDDIKIADFSLSHVSGDPAFGPDRTGGRPGWMSPEWHLDEVSTPAADVWAFGMTVLHVSPQFFPSIAELILDRAYVTLISTADHRRSILFLSLEHLSSSPDNYPTIILKPERNWYVKS